MTSSAPLKETAISPARVESIAVDLQRVYPVFDSAGFVSAVVPDLPDLGLKQRVASVADALAHFLPANIEHATTLMVSALPEHDDATFAGSDFGEYTFAPYSDFLARHACRREHLGTSLPALAELTKHFTAEDALRYFLRAFPDETMVAVTAWSRDPDYHVRRLASEGTRPFLPWSPRITVPTTAAIPILDTLHTDSHRFVTTSVGNHLNDIARIDPDLVLTTLTRWRAAGQQTRREMDFIIRTALRTLVKQGHHRAFEFLGLSTSPAVEVVGLALAETVIPVGGELVFDVTVRARKAERVVIDYAVHYPRVSGATGETVFKLKTLDLLAGQTLTLYKRQSMRSTASRRIGAGAGCLQIQVNGTRTATASFDLRAPAGT